MAKHDSFRIGEVTLSREYIRNHVRQYLWKQSVSLNTMEEHDEVADLVMKALDGIVDNPEGYSDIDWQLHPPKQETV